jgi:hypothetical protein
MERADGVVLSEGPGKGVLARARAAEEDPHAVNPTWGLSARYPLRYARKREPT